MTKLTKEQLDMLTKLQPLFKEKMGEWQIRDEEWTEGLGMGVLYHNGLTYFDNGTRINPMWCDEILRIPKPIDWQNPERGLWGMVDWEQYDKKCIRDDGELRLVRRVWDSSAGILTDPFTALLKALCEQEGV